MVLRRRRGTFQWGAVLRKACRAALTGFFLLLCAGFAPAQEDWEGKIVEDVVPKGFHLIRPREQLARLNARKGQPYTLLQRDEDTKILYETRTFDDIKILISPGSAPDRIVVTIEVVEAPVIQDVLFTGLQAIPIAQIRPKLRLNPGDRLSPHLLKVDRDAIREEYLVKGYHFSSVKEEIATAPGGVILHWQVAEGPMVTVREILFSGNRSFPDSRLKEFLLTKENSWLLFIPAGTNPFVMRYLEEDLKRIRLFYQLEGWLDIADGDRVFVEDLLFNDDKTEVTIKIHIDEGRRYVIRKIDFRGNQVYGADELRSFITLKVGDEYNERVAGEDIKKIRDKYGERAYIMAEIQSPYTVDLEKHELDLVFEIKENQEIRVGRIMVNGNFKTRMDVILRELRDFTPGDKFNNKLLNRGLLRLRDRGYFEPQGGIQVRLEQGLETDEQDVIIDVKEGPTGNIRFAGGYSSSFGILGILELTQKNFDVTDLPKSLEDFFGGTAFAGGGQLFSVRLAPSARRQSFTVNFREPYLFGYEYGLGLRGYSIKTEREDWDEGRLGGAVTLDKRIDDFRLELGFNAFRIDIDNVGSAAPATVQSLLGENTIISLTPAVIFDTRDSQMFPSEGVKISLSTEHAGRFLGGDFDFWKTVFDFDTYLTILETEDKLKHVLQFHWTVGVAKEIGDSRDVPFFERFYAGGRDSIRGFEFRGMGPHENGDPVGGNAYAFGSVEYSLPLLVEFLRGAVFYDIADLTPEFDDMRHDKWRQTVGFGIRFLIPQLGNVPVALDFGFPLTKQDEDERQTVTFDIGKLF
ncbi:MAG: outer membrane protein assembly factor BamA [Planctomycetes bacterium]|nr:outer membrane protein assembly factor BamA [Planctomycetota bacterium]